MQDKMYIGIDNGVTGRVSILEGSTCVYHGPTPIKNCLNYTKEKQNLNRVDVVKLEELLKEFMDMATTKKIEVLCILERPMVNPTRWKASVSAIRALEATLTVLERLNVPYQYEDSKSWQKMMLPTGLQKTELKIAANEVAKRLFPKIKTNDADSLIMAEYARRKGF